METELRMALLVAGLALLVAVYLWGWSKSRKSRKRKFENFDFDTDPLPTPPDSGPVPAVDPLEAVLEDEEDAPELEIEEVLEEEEKGPGYQPSLLGQEAEGQPTVSKLIILHVMAKRPRMFNGTDIVGIAREFGLEYDQMNVFHKKVKRRGGKRAMYSIVNAVKPGTFDLDRMDKFETPGISFVMSLPGPEKGLKAFNIMMEAAKKTAERLRGDLLDESRNRLNAQAITRMKEDVQLFILKHPNHTQ